MTCWRCKLEITPDRIISKDRFVSLDYEDETKDGDLCPPCLEHMEMIDALDWETCDVTPLGGSMNFTPFEDYDLEFLVNMQPDPNYRRLIEQARRANQLARAVAHQVHDHFEDTECGVADGLKFYLGQIDAWPYKET